MRSTGAQNTPSPRAERRNDNFVSMASRPWSAIEKGRGRLISFRRRSRTAGESVDSPTTRIGQKGWIAMPQGFHGSRGMRSMPG